MGVLFFTIMFHLKSAIKKLLFKLIYLNQIHFGKRFCFRRKFYLYIAKGAKVSIGDGSFFNNNVSINCLEKITIGKRCLIGENVKLYDHNHRFRDLSRPIAEQGFTTKPITRLLDLQQRNNSSGRNDRRPQRNRRGLPDLQGCSAENRCNRRRENFNAPH